MNGILATDSCDPLMSVRGITKTFAGIEVLRNVDLDIEPGEVHALVGENGAGKSTFANILSGVFRPTRGTMRLAGEVVTVSSPLEAQRLGIALIHQEPVSFPDLSVAENLVLGRSQSALSWVRWPTMALEARLLMSSLGVEIDVTKPMRGLSISNQQMVEIARALSSDSRLIIMDEPTAALTPKEVDMLFATIRRFRDEGRTIILISHRLEEVRTLCDRVTIFRDGEKVATAPTSTLTDTDIIRLMIGRPFKEYLHKTTSSIGDTVLDVRELSLPGRFENVTFEIRKGEIVGLGGLVGAGRSDVACALFGIAPAESGSVAVNGQRATIRNPADAIRLRIAFVPEDRAVAGIFHMLSVESNITAAVPRRIAPRGIIRRSVEHADAKKFVLKLEIKIATLRQPIGEASGGNQQKAILARWLLTEPVILILDEPTRGIDIGAKAEFHDTIGKLAGAGCAILLISSDLPELLALSDRILVMSEGRLTANIPRVEATQETIMHAAVPRAERQ
ncbi:MAG: sugar ABC transporter ATP-binding protein [Terriglobales bacterium]